MNDKVCGCQFCIDYKRFQEVLPTIPAEHREWFESIFDALWNTQEELSYRNSVLNGSWPDSVVILERALVNARKLKDLKDLAETPLNFDCKVCEICNKAMTSAQYWAHPCQQPEYEHQCDVVDISDGPCGDPSHDKPVSVAYDYEDEVGEIEDDGFMGGDHLGDFF